MKEIITGVLIICLFTLAGCAKAKTEPIRVAPVSGETLSVTALEQLVFADNDFGFRMFSQLTDNNPQGNIFISPTSIEMCLRMLYNGASGKTKVSIAKTLGLGEMALDDINQANLTLTDQLKSSDPKVILNIANSLWAQQGIKFKDKFIESNKNYYNTEITNLDFSDNTSAQRINNWVTDKTNEKITKIVDELDPSMLLVLVNAIYFKGKWTIEFDKAKTEQMPFTLLDSTQKQVPMMIQDGNYRYFEDDNLQAISLPYGKEGRMSMYVVLPKSTYRLSDFVSTLNENTWNELIAQFRYREGDIYLPRFKFEYEKTLNNPLIELGMKNTFNDADFTNMTDTPAFVSGVIHKTFVEVNEEGTEAAAVTAVFVATAVANQPEPFTMVVDHPFFCAIRDNDTGTILFMGAVVEPK